ncbi:MAG: hypothetical protein AAFY28_13235 [Actinomycetota bacterium]
MPGNPLTDPNWPRETTDTIVEFVGTVREQTTTKVVYAARAVVFGLIAAIVGMFTAVLVVIGLLRGVQALFDLGVSSPRAVYLSYFTVGGIFCLVGAFLFRKRNAETGV